MNSSFTKETFLLSDFIWYYMTLFSMLVVVWILIIVNSLLVA